MARQTESIQLSKKDRYCIISLIRLYTSSRRKFTRAHILLRLEEQMLPVEISKYLKCSLATVYNVKRRYLSEGLEASLGEKPRSGKPTTISSEARARIIALAYSEPPIGHTRWSLRLLAAKALELGICDAISHQMVRQILNSANRSST